MPSLIGTSMHARAAGARAARAPTARTCRRVARCVREPIESQLPCACPHHAPDRHLALGAAISPAQKSCGRVRCHQHTRRLTTILACTPRPRRCARAGYRALRWTRTTRQPCDARASAARFMQMTTASGASARHAPSVRSASTRARHARSSQRARRRPRRWPPRVMTRSRYAASPFAPRSTPPPTA